MSKWIFTVKTRNKNVHFKIYTKLYECETARAYVTKVVLYYYSAYLKQALILNTVVESYF
jgi:hypothetical protein